MTYQGEEMETCKPRYRNRGYNGCGGRMQAGSMLLHAHPHRLPLLCAPDIGQRQGEGAHSIVSGGSGGV